MGKRLTQEKVREVRRFFADFPDAKPAKAAFYCGVSETTARNIRNGAYNEPEKGPTLFDAADNSAVLEQLKQINEGVAALRAALEGVLP